MSNSLDPDQDRHPDLGPNCLQRLSADNKSRHHQGKSSNNKVQENATIQRETNLAVKKLICVMY